MIHLKRRFCFLLIIALISYLPTTFFALTFSPDFENPLPSSLPTTIPTPVTTPQTLTHINNADVIFSGEMLTLHDEANWEDVLFIWDFHFNTAAAYCENDDQAEALLILENLDVSQVNIHEAGEYMVTLTLGLSEEDAQKFILAERLRTITIPVKVADPAIFEIWLLRSTVNKFYLTWVHPIRNISEILYASSDFPLSEDELTNVNWQQAPSQLALANNYNFNIAKSGIELNKHYYFRLKGEDTLSNIIHLLDDGSSIYSDYIGGDRDGGDGGGVQPPSLIQPPPESPNLGDTNNDKIPENSFPTAPPLEKEDIPNFPTTKDDSTKHISLELPLPTLLPTPTVTPLHTPNLTPTAPTDNVSIPKLDTPTTKRKKTSSLPIPTSSPLPSSDIILPSSTSTTYDFMEVFGETQDILSGTRLYMMFENGGGIAYFSKQGLMLSIPQTSLETYAIQNTDQITLTLANSTLNEVTISLLINDMPLTLIDDMQLMLPYTAAHENTLLYLKDKKNRVVSTGQYDAATRLATFTLHEMGTFLIQEEYLEEFPPTATPPITPTSNSSSRPMLLLGFLSLLILLSYGFWLFTKRRRS